MVRKSDEATIRHWCIDLLNCLFTYVNIDSRYEELPKELER